VRATMTRSRASGLERNATAGMLLLDPPDDFYPPQQRGFSQWPKPRPPLSSRLCSDQRLVEAYTFA
jgi:hypothetical protein